MYKPITNSHADESRKIATKRAITGNAKEDNIVVDVYNNKEDDYLRAKKRFSDYNTAIEWAKNWEKFLLSSRDVACVDMSDYVQYDNFIKTIK